MPFGPSFFLPFDGDVMTSSELSPLTLYLDVQFSLPLSRLAGLASRDSAFELLNFSGDRLEFVVGAIGAGCSSPSSLRFFADNISLRSGICLP